MLDIGWPELFLIGVVVLLVVGPKELPKVLRNIGQWVNKAKIATREFRTHVDDMIRDSEVEEVRDQINEAGSANFQSITENTIGLQNEVEDVLKLEGEGYTNPITSYDESEDDENNENESQDKKNDDAVNSASGENQGDEDDEFKGEVLTSEGGTAN